MSNLIIYLILLFFGCYNIYRGRRIIYTGQFSGYKPRYSIFVPAERVILTGHSVRIIARGYFIAGSIAIFFLIVSLVFNFFDETLALLLSLIFMQMSHAIFQGKAYQEFTNSHDT